MADLDPLVHSGLAAAQRAEIAGREPPNVCELADLEIPAETEVFYLHSPGELSRTYPEEGYPVPVRRVHVRLYLEDKAGEWLFEGRDHAGDRFPRQRSRSLGHKGVEQLLDAKGVDRAPEKYRGLGPGKVRFLRERVGCTFEQLDIGLRTIASLLGTKEEDFDSTE